MNLLIIPSWYPQPDDKINGSFFQEQARLVSDRFDVKVLHIRFILRPSIRALLRTPIKAGGEWLRYFLQKKERSQLPDDEVFTQPPLIEYRVPLFDLTAAGRHRTTVAAYLLALDELIASGWKPDLVHAHSANPGGLVAQRIKETLGIPYVITEHKPFALCNFPEFLRDKIKRAFREAITVLALGHDMVRLLGISGIAVEPNLIYNLVDEQLFSRVSDAYEPGRPLRLVSIGAASHYKDHPTLLRALIILREREIPFTLTMIGLKVWGDLYDHFVEWIHNNDLESVVTVIDQVDRAEVCDLLAAHDVYVMTSIFETFCVSIIEALACGLPVVTTNHGGGSTEFINDNSGQLVSVRNHRAFADALERIYRGTILYDPQRIRDYVISMCGRRAFSERLIGYYEASIDPGLSASESNVHAVNSTPTS